MRAAVLRAVGEPLVVETVPDPVAGAGEAVVDVFAAPVLSYAAEVFSGARAYPMLLPIVPGVGAVGRVRAVGPDATQLAVGDWVFCDPTVRPRDATVGVNDIVLQGWIAPTDGAERLMAHFRDGPFAERMRVPMENAVRLGEVDPAEAVRWCAINTLAIPYGGLLASGLRAGETVLVNGATGHIGSGGVVVALALNAGRVVAAGRNEATLADLRRRFGPRVVPAPMSGDPATDADRLRDAAGGGPVDRVLDLLPPMPDSTPVRTAVMAVRPGGTVVLMGGSRVDVSLPYAFLMRNNITVRGQWMYPRDAPPAWWSWPAPGCWRWATWT